MAKALRMIFTVAYLVTKKNYRLSFNVIDRTTRRTPPFFFFKCSTPRTGDQYDLFPTTVHCLVISGQMDITPDLYAGSSSFMLPGGSGIICVICSSSTYLPGWTCTSTGVHGNQDLFRWVKIGV